jgi:pilus assembly protein CpaF
MPAVLEPAPNSAARESGWVNRLSTREEFTPEYQELKFTLHRHFWTASIWKRYLQMAGDRVRAQVRAAVAKLVDEQKSPLSLVEKDRIIEEVLDEVFGLGPLEPLLQDPTVSDILVTTPRLFTSSAPESSTALR